MTGTRNNEGYKEMADRFKAIDPDYYRKIGALGGRSSRTGGFYVNRELARVAGRKGGKIGGLARGRRTGRTGSKRKAA